MISSTQRKTFKYCVLNGGNMYEFVSLFIGYSYNGNAGY